MRAPFALERYAEDLRDRTAWAGDVAIEECEGEVVPREALYRMGHLWALALLDDRFEDLLLPVLVTEAPLLDQLERESRERGWGLAGGWFEERLRSRACLLLFDGGAAEEWPGNVRFRSRETVQSQITCRSSS